MQKIIIRRRQISEKNIQLPSIKHRLLEKLYLTRGITSEKELDHSTKALLDYQKLSGIDCAVNILYQAVLQNKNILIVGDFDADGATSTALIMTALQQFGVNTVEYIIPDRFDDGYGLSVSLVKKAIQKKANLIITVDNGISANEAVTFAKKNNIQVIITDHHLSPDILPDADAIINPNLPFCDFPSKCLAGVGVTFYFMIAFRAYLRSKNWFEENKIKEYNLANLLDLVALGTVADVVSLDQNNRILVQQGLNRIRSGYGCVGIEILVKMTKKELSSLTSQDLAYYLAPRINAAGRMENMFLGVELLLAKNEHDAIELASVLEDLNSERKMVEQQMKKSALEFINKLDISENKIPNSFVIHNPDFHQGVIGVLSSRIKEKYNRPVISFASTDDGFLKGSGRSIKGIHLRDILERINIRETGLIVGFGGHAMAAGLTIKKQNLEKFTRYFTEEINSILNNTILEHIVETDGEIENDEFTFDTAKMLKENGPWGSCFPEPCFDGDFIIHKQTLIADKHLKMVIEPIMGGPLLNSIAFNIDRTLWPDQSVKIIKIVYNLETDEFRGNQSVTLLIRHLVHITE